jgi:transposase
MLKALIAGDHTPEALAELAQRRMRRKRAALGEALTGRATAHHRFMLDHRLRHIEFLDDAIATSDRHIERLTAADADALARLHTIPGAARRTAEVIAAELGCDMTRFPCVGHAASWTGLCPRGAEDRVRRLPRARDSRR